MTAAAPSGKGLKISGSSAAVDTMVAVFLMARSSPSSSTRLPAPAAPPPATMHEPRSVDRKMPVTVRVAESSSSSGVKPSPSTRTVWPTVTVPL